ncbi:aldo/keto reductase [uncultured Sphingobacterium sp.]|uniref:aldo/keto reductase n=1 Tax=uncultured Sphingobacterium sp. TaxID=182688 RepID=UPI0037485D6B
MSISKTITIGANTDEPLTIKRFGYGTMRLTAEHGWGEPKDKDEALKVLKATIENGISFIDTADFYGEDVTNRLIAEALYPYADDLLLCTKVGPARTSLRDWHFFDKPENLRTSIEKNLATLKLERIPLVHFRYMPGSPTPFEASMEEMFKLQQEGKILHLGVSCVGVQELTKALNMGNIASVENAFGYGQRTTFQMHGVEVRGLQEVMDICIDNKIPMVPYWSLQNAKAEGEDKIAVIAKKYNTSETIINLAWLLHYNDLILPIPGTSKLKHFEENIKALDVNLTQEDMQFLG